MADFKQKFVIVHFLRFLRVASTKHVFAVVLPIDLYIRPRRNRHASLRFAIPLNQKAMASPLTWQHNNKNTSPFLLLLLLHKTLEPSTDSTSLGYFLRNKHFLPNFFST